MPSASLASPQFNPPPVPKGTTRRVCFVAPFGLGQKTTVWARTQPLAKALTAHGWQVTILIPPWDTSADAGKRWYEPGALSVGVQASSSALGTVEIVNVPLSGGPPAVTNRLLREIRARQPHIVHIVKPRAYAGLVQWLLWQRRQPHSAPILLDIDDWEQAWASINRYPWPLARLGAWQEEWGIRHAAGITAASRWLVERAGSYAPQTPLLYLPNGVPQPAPAPPPHPTANTEAILFFTRFVEVSPAWLSALAVSLYAIRPQTRLIVAGTPVQPGLDEPFRRTLSEALTAAGAPLDQVDWLGFVPPADLPALYARCGCAIFPAAPVPLQQAKCSVRLATTLLQGIPVVASAVGEQAAYGADGAARLVPADASPAEFAAAVDNVLRHPEQQIALAEAARARLLERYAWDKQGGELAHFYTKFV